MSTNERKRKTDIFVDHKIEPNEKKRKLSSDVFYHDPLNCIELKAIKRKDVTSGEIREWMDQYYSEIDLIYSDDMKIRFEERRDRTYNIGGNGFVVHYKSMNIHGVIHFSIKYTSDDEEEKTISKINRTGGSEPCGQIKIKGIGRFHNQLTSKPLFLFLSKTYDGSLSDFTEKANLLDNSEVQNIIVQVKDQLICLRKKYNMCYMDIKPGNILYLYPGRNNDRKNIEVALGDLGSDGMTTFMCVSSEDNRTYQFGGCDSTELLSDCQKYTLSLTYLMLRDGYDLWDDIAMDPNANRNTVRDVQNALRSEVIPGGRTMYEIIWDTKEVTKSTENSWMRRLQQKFWL
jgi:hypothetical protein